MGTFDLLGIDENGQPAWGANAMSLTDMIRKWARDSIAAYLARIAAERAIPGDEQDAEIRWGAASDFSQIDMNLFGGFRIIDNNKPDNKPKPIAQYKEISKETEKIRVQNPDDASQWVEIERRTSSTIQRDDNTKFRITWDNS